MSRDPLDIIWRLADCEDPILTGDDVRELRPEVFDRLRSLGLLRPAETARHVTCDACTGQYVCEVILLEYPGGHTRSFIRCPECGRIEIPEARLLQWSADFPMLLVAFATAISASPEALEVVPGRVWNLGRATLAGRSRPIWATLGLGWVDAGSAVEALPKGRAPVVFFLGQPPEDGLLDIPSESVFDLRSLVRLTEGHIRVDVEAIESQLQACVREVKKKTPRKRASRTAAIELMEKALTDHIISARDRAYAAIDRGESPELLPRPEQQFLAAQLGLSRPTVTRLLKDKSAHKLRLLWDMAIDLEQVLKYGKRR